LSDGIRERFELIIAEFETGKGGQVAKSHGERPDLVSVKLKLCQLGEVAQRVWESFDPIVAEPEVWMETICV
jgi:hypothetical protein